MNEIIIAGAGAAGLFAAIHSARAGAKVTVIEKNETLGKKLLATGNGKCNFTNAIQHQECYHSHDLSKAWHILQEFTMQDTLDFFQKAGMMIHKQESYFYPYSRQASSVLQLLIRLAKKEGVHFITKAQIKNITPKSSGFSITFLKDNQKQSLTCDKVILATGGYAAPKTGSNGDGYYIATQLGHKIIPTIPALCGLHVKETDIKAISGIRFDADVTLVVDEKIIQAQTGQVQFTDYGVSGIVVFQLSSYVGYALQDNKKVRIDIDLLPDYSYEEWKQIACHHKKSDMTIGEWCNGIFPGKLSEYLLYQCHISPNRKMLEVEDSVFLDFLQLCKQLSFIISGTNSFEQAQVTAGGIDLTQVDDTLQSRLVNGLYFAGEILDVDGICGGYNLQWAWSSGYVAGVHAAKTKSKKRKTLCERK